MAAVLLSVAVVDVSVVLAVVVRQASVMRVVLRTAVLSKEIK